MAGKVALKQAHQGFNTNNSNVKAGAAHKPNSVPVPVAPEAGDDHSSEGNDCPLPLATYPGARTGRPQALPYLVLHRVGFTKLLRSPEELVRSYRTFSPLPEKDFPACWKIPDRRYAFCCTFLHVAATPRYGAPCPAVFGLSSGSCRAGTRDRLGYSGLTILTLLGCYSPSLR